MSNTPQFLRNSTAAASLLIVFALIIALNVIVSNMRMRLDVTEDKVYTLSEGTKAILGKLDKDVSIKLFISRSSKDIPPQFKDYASEVEDLIAEYELLAKGRIKVERYDPKPDSDEELWAVNFGVPGQSISFGGPQFYLGLAIVSGDKKDSIPFLNPDNRRELEYTLTRMVMQVSTSKKPKLGVVSSIPVMGVQAPPFAMPGQPMQQGRPPFLLFQEISQLYDIQELSMPLKAVPTDLSALLVIHPKSVDTDSVYAIDQFVMNGGNLLVYVDPLGVLDARDNPSPNPMGGPPVNSDLPELFKAWGVEYSPNKVVADPNALFGGERENIMTFLALKDENMNLEDVVTSRLSLCAMYNAGSFKVTPTEGVSVDSLVQTSEAANHVGDMQARFGGQAIAQEFKRGKEKLDLAVRLSGKFKSAFPDGPPKKEEEAPEVTPAVPFSTDGHLAQAASESVIILIADVDILYDEANFQVIQTPFGNQAMRQNDNPFLFGNSVEQVLLGSAELTKVRSKQRTDRYFERVRKMEQKADAAIQDEAKKFQAEIDEANDRLRQIQAASQGDGRMIIDAQQKEEEQINKRIVEVQKELRELRKTHREDIEKLENQVTASSIFLMPCLIALFGFGFWFYRRSKTA